MRRMVSVFSLLKKIVYVLFLLFALSVLVFFMSRFSPGDPMRAYYGDGVERMSSEQKAAARQRLGLDKPLLIQYGKWLVHAAKGDFGISYQYKQKVTTVIGQMYVNTLFLGGISYAITFLLALFLGIFCAMREDSFVDHIICRVGTITNCIPSFWVSLVLIILFSVNLKLLPSSGAYTIGAEHEIGNRIVHLILPTVVMVIGHLWYYAYMIRNRLLEEVRKDYVLTAKAKGLNTRQIMFGHCLPNILPMFFCLMAISIPHIIAGTYIVEEVFSYPGLGTLCFESAKYHDYNMLMVLSLLTGVIVILSNFFARALGEKIDPRMNLASGRSLG